MKRTQAWLAAHSRDGDGKPAFWTREMWRAVRQSGIFLAGIMIFAADSLTVTDGLASAFYILILLGLAESRQTHEIAGGAILCIFLTFATYPLAYGFNPVFYPFFRREISAAAILFVLPVIAYNIRLRQELSTLDMFLEITNHPIIMRDRDDRITFWNGAAQRLYGWTTREALGRNFFALTGRDHAPAARQVLTGAKIFARAKDGRLLTLLSRSLGEEGARGRKNSLEILTDITLLEQGTEALRQSELRYRTIFNMVDAGLLELDVAPLLRLLDARRVRNGLEFYRLCKSDPSFGRACAGAVRLLDANDTATRMLAARNKTDLARRFHWMLGLVAATECEMFISALLDGAAIWHGAHTVASLRGKRLSLLVSAKFSCGQGRTGRVLVSLVDETGRRDILRAIADARHALLHVNRISALGEMTATIAHQVNHPLAAAIANAEAALRWLNRAAPDRGEALLAVSEVARNVAAAADIVANIQGQDTGASELFSLGDIISNVCRLLEHDLARHGIAVRHEMEFQPLSLRGDRVEVEQVLVNLLVNAIESVAGIAAPRDIVIRAGRAGEGMFRVQIQDNGPGLRGLDPGRLFEPLYTTKATGTGLGLAICRAIIHRHGGDISLTDATPCGALAEFTLAGTGDAVPAKSSVASACGARA